MTCIKHKGTYWEWTYLLDVFNNEIIASSVTNKVGSNLPYYHCLEYLIEKRKSRPTRSPFTQTKVVSTHQQAFTKPTKIILILYAQCQEQELQQTTQLLNP